VLTLTPQKDTVTGPAEGELIAESGRSEGASTYWSGAQDGMVCVFTAES
jgi:hypothetical protein